MSDVTHDIVDTAVAAGSLTTLVAAVTAAGLVETFKGAGPFTVFAPTDEAFAELPAGTVEELVKPENNEKLAAIFVAPFASGCGKMNRCRGQDDRSSNGWWDNSPCLWH